MTLRRSSVEGLPTHTVPLTAPAVIRMNSKSMYSLLLRYFVPTYPMRCDVLT